MSILFGIIHCFACIALILIVLLQTGKGADMGAAFGGGSSQTLFGSTGASTFLSKATTIAAVVFMITSLSLAYMSGHRQENSIMKNVKSSVAESPVQTTVPGDSSPSTELPLTATPETPTASPDKTE